jgi:hypothetical protein
MLKNEKFKVENLEKLGSSDAGIRGYSEDELLDLIKDKDRFPAVFQEDKIDILRIMFDKLRASPEFRGKVREVIGKQKKSSGQ